MDNNIRQKQLEFLQKISQDSFVKSHKYDYTWQVGSTVVYPIQEGQDGVYILWKTDRPCKSWIDKIVSRHSDILKYGYFSKSDGSCPSEVVFKYQNLIEK